MSRDWHRLRNLGFILIGYGIVCILGVLFAPFLRPYTNVEAEDQFGTGQFDPLVSVFDGMAVLTVAFVVLGIIVFLIWGAIETVQFFWPMKKED